MNACMYVSQEWTFPQDLGLHMYACKHAWMHACLNMLRFTHTQAKKYTDVSGLLSKALSCCFFLLCVYVYTYMHTYIHTHTCVHICVYICTHVGLVAQEKLPRADIYDLPSSWRAWNVSSQLWSSRWTEVFLPLLPTCCFDQSFGIIWQLVTWSCFWPRNSDSHGGCNLHIRQSVCEYT